MNETILILRDRFKSLEETLGLDDKDFAMAFFDYCGYICSSWIISPVVKEMIKEGDIDENVVHWLFIFGGLRNTVRNFKTGKMKEESGIPLFWDKEIEDMYGVAIELGKFIYMSKEAPHTKNKDTIDIYDMISDGSGNLILHEDFPIKNIIIKIRLFQNDLLTRLTKPSQLTVSFDIDLGLLKLVNKKIYFRKYTEQYHTLKIIFENKENLKNEIFFSEIAEKLDSSKGYSDKDFHNYFSAIKKRVSAETGIKDLFITTTQSIKINPNYIPK